MKYTFPMLMLFVMFTIGCSSSGSSEPAPIDLTPEEPVIAEPIEIDYTISDIRSVSYPISVPGQHHLSYVTGLEFDLEYTGPRSLSFAFEYVSDSAENTHTMNLNGDVYSFARVNQLANVLVIYVDDEEVGRAWLVGDNG